MNHRDKDMKKVGYESLWKLTLYVEEENFCGYDPYDALNSPFLKALSLGCKYPRIAFTQALKRLPINLRPILGIKKELNPKAIGLFLWGYAKLFSTEKAPEYLGTIYSLLDQLQETKCRGYSGDCWGYNFDWQSRAFFVPKHTPTVVNSSLIGHALLDTYELTGVEEALDMAISIREFILQDLNRTDDGKDLCFSYTPIDRLIVHNANLLGGSLLIRINGYDGNLEAKEAALSSLAYTMKHQQPDGSWNYAESDYQQWIDSFHTGYNLQSILYFLLEGCGMEHADNFAKGLKFYQDNFFLEDGTPKYYHDRIYPIDIHAPAQAVVLFSMLGAEYRRQAELVVGWMTRHLQDRRGFFYFQKARWFTNRIPYMRWGQAWAFHALTSFLAGEKQ